MQRNSKMVSSHMMTHTPYKMAVSVKQRGKSTESWAVHLEPLGTEPFGVFGHLGGWECKIS